MSWITRVPAGQRLGALLTAALACLFVYFAQYLTVPPNSSEGAVMMDYVHRLSEGQRLHFDVFDYYGPVAWLPYSFFYSAFGQQMIGVRVALLLLKLVSVILTYVLIRSLGRRFYAVFGALTVAVLVGQPWPFFQIPYAPHLTFPMMLCVWLLVFPVRLGAGWLRLVGAGVITALLLWTKVNTGAYVLAGVAVYLACWEPRADVVQRSSSRFSEAALRAVQGTGLVVVVVGFHWFLLAHLNALYFVYLSLPLLVGTVWTARHLSEAWRAGRSAKPQLAAGAVYVASTLAVWAVLFVAYFGLEGGKAYVSEQLSVLSRFHYQSALLMPGARGQYQGFNEYFWPQLPWLTTLTALYWLLTRHRRRAERDAAWLEHAEARLAGLFIAGTLYCFVIYARGDESHLVQGVLGAAVVLFAMLAVIDNDERSDESRRSMGRWMLGFVTVLGMATLFARPRSIDFDLTFGDWANPRLTYLRYHTEADVRARELPLAMNYDQWDSYIDATAQQVDELTQDGEEVLVLSAAQLINYASSTEPAGGKYSHFFYLLRCGLLDRAAFFELVPKETIGRLLSSPPRVVVLQDGDAAITEALPELHSALRRVRYRYVSRAGPFAIWVRATP
ncbi:MAG TPA: hypothetical protein VI072_10450 [Polyangiaceae bacterium]